MKCLCAASFAFFTLEQCWLIRRAFLSRGRGRREEMLKVVMGPGLNTEAAPSINLQRKDLVIESPQKPERGGVSLLREAKSRIAQKPNLNAIPSDYPINH
ncbi:hypothetical protein DL93DRAFT_483612 [Clavulina sp. PMI_390]|nr:hypothetical protein DL93DRAFT_483612 [Clavulina sp. PMI_390]